MDIKITDFGIAKIENQVQQMTAPSSMGSPIYMAPEQYTDASKVDRRADIYSVGVILYELMTFRQPIGNFPMPASLNPLLPKQVDEIIKKAINNEKEMRYIDASSLIKDMEKASEFDQSALFKKIYEEEFGMFGGSAYGALIGDYEFSNHPQDMGLLEKISQVAAAAHAPFISAASAAMFNLDSFTDIGTSFLVFLSHT